MSHLPASGLDKNCMICEKYGVGRGGGADKKKT